MENRKRILFVTSRNFQILGGIERYVDNFIKHYSPKETNLIFLVPNTALGRIRRNAGIQYMGYDLPFRVFNNFLRFLNPLLSIGTMRRDIRRKIKEIRPDLIWTNDYDSVLAAAGSCPVYFMPGSLLKMDLMFDYCFGGSYFYRLSRWLQMQIKVMLERTAFKVCQRVIVFSQAFKDRIVRHCHVPADKVMLVPVGIDLLDAPPSVPIEKGTILSVSRLAKSKNIDLALAALRHLDGYRLLIAGDGQERKSLVAKIQEYGLTERVRLLGHKENVAELYQRCEIFIHLSRYENFGLVLLEAMLFGKSPIVLRPELPGVHTASAEIVRDGYNGFFVDDDAVAIARKIKEVAALNRETLAEHCQDFARQFSFEQHITKLFDLLQRS